MFTGLVQKAQIVSNESLTQGRRLVVQPVFENLALGESIAINGACLTLKAEDKEGLVFDVSPESLTITNLSSLQVGQLVNVERSMLASTRFGGHYVSGHIDTTATLCSMNKADVYLEIKVGHFGMPAKPYLLPKGSIALDGVSLTINQVVEEVITIMLVPHTLSHTAFSDLDIGQSLNVEFDYFTKIVAHQLTLSQVLAE